MAMIDVYNHHGGVITVDLSTYERGKVKKAASLRLLPGPNQIDQDEWFLAAKKQTIQYRIDRGILQEGVTEAPMVRL
jgi:hypothetical protein